MFHSGRRKLERTPSRAQRPYRAGLGRFFRPILEILEKRVLLSTTAADNPAVATYLTSPLGFEENQGQADSQVRFLARGQNATLFLTPSEAVLSLVQPAATTASGAAPTAGGQTAVLQMQLDGANPAPQVVGVDPLAATSNYLLGNDPSQWHVGVPTFGQVEYQQVYRGIDLLFHGSQQQLEYDFQVAAGADPGQVALDFQGQDGLAVDADTGRGT